MGTGAGVLCKKEAISRIGTIGFHDTSISVWEERPDEALLEVLDETIRHFRRRGFAVKIPGRIKKNYSCIKQDFRDGKKGDLEVGLRLSGRCFKVTFFQNVNIKNQNGGRYDFDKYEMMPYLMRKQFLLEGAKLVGLFRSFGYDYGKQFSSIRDDNPALRLWTAIKGYNPAKEPLRSFNEGWTAHRFKRDETGWPIPKEYDYGYNKDREGVSLRNGMFRYFRDSNGYLMRGNIFTNMNSMWMVVFGVGSQDITYRSARDLFTLQPSDPRGRWFSEEHRRNKLEGELKRAADNLNFERAAVLRDLLGYEVAPSK